jgi:hypothetical protein
MHIISNWDDDIAYSTFPLIATSTAGRNLLHDESEERDYFQGAFYRVYVHY